MRLTTKDYDCAFYLHFNDKDEIRRVMCHRYEEEGDMIVFYKHDGEIACVVKKAHLFAIVPE